MDEDLDSRAIDFRQHIHNIFNEVTDEIGSPINISLLFDRLVPTFFDSSQLATSPKDNRQAGYLAFYQSFTSYTIKHYYTLSTAILEQILLQTVTLLPITKIAACLQLGDDRYDSSWESDDRLLILLGELVSFYGSSTVDSFLHPLFKQHIFDQIHVRQPDQQSVLQFENLIKSRGGIVDIYYQQLEVAYPQIQWRWECTITYQFRPKTPLLFHHRTGKNKKQAKLRTLHDIYNYYSRCDTDMVLYSDAWLTDHPHCRPHTNISKFNSTRLSIPIEKMHEYDDEDYENTSLEERLARRNNPNYIDIPDIYNEDPVGYLEKLTQILLGDDMNSNNNNNDSPKAYPLPATTQQNNHPSPLPAAVSSPIPSAQSTSTSPTLRAGGFATVNEQNVKRSPVLKKDQHTTNGNGKTGVTTDSQQGPSTTNKKIISTNNNYNALNINILNDPGNQSVTTTISPTPTPSAPAPAPAQEKAPGTLQASEQHLIAKTKQLMNLFTVNDRYRLNNYSENLRRNPNDTKGCLMNLARKLDNGYYQSSAEHIQLGKVTERAHYIVTVRFGTPQVELSLARGHTKKSTAESLAALAIFGLVEKVSKTINAEMKLPFLD